MKAIGLVDGIEVSLKPDLEVWERCDLFYIPGQTKITCPIYEFGTVNEMNYGFEREGGFINRQPSLAECLTCLTPVGDAFQSSSIKCSTLSPATLLPLPLSRPSPAGARAASPDTTAGARAASPDTTAGARAASPDTT